MAARMVVSTVFKAVDKVTRPMRKMTRATVRAGKAMTRGLTGVLKVGAKLARGVLSLAANFTKVGAVATGAAVAATVALNKSTEQAQQLAEAIGVNVDLLEGLGAAIRPAGFELDHIVDLVEEMNNKLGESAGLQQTTPVQESLKILGLSFEKLRKLSPEEQFKTIGDAILKMKDHAKAVSAADILFGGEANKIFGVLRKTGKSIDDIVGGYKELNFQTDKSRKGAGRFMQQFGRLTTMVSTLARFVAGLAGDALEPLIDKMQKWVIANKELIQTRVEEFFAKLPGLLEQIGTKALSLWNTLEEYGPTFKTLAKLAGQFFKIMAAGVGAIEKTFVVVGTFIGETIAKLVLAIEKAREFLGLTGDDDEAPPTARRRQRGPVPGAMSSPQERAVNALEEKRMTNTTEVVLKDETGKARVTRGAKNRGFSMVATGAPA